MKIDREIPFDRVHRLGKYNSKHQYPRPIVTKFTFFKDRELVRKSAHSALAGSNMCVKEIETERNRLYGPAKEARENPEDKPNELSRKTVTRTSHLKETTQIQTGKIQLTDGQVQEHVCVVNHLLMEDIHCRLRRFITSLHHCNLHRNTPIL